MDVFQTDGAPIKLFMADMDSTIVSGETLDDMAQLVGIGDKVADITTRAMRGEFDFEQLELFHSQHYKFHFWQFGLLAEY